MPRYSTRAPLSPIVPETWYAPRMFEGIIAQARTALQSVEPEQAANATRDHVEMLDAESLAQHLKDAAQTMGGAQLASLGQSVLSALAQNGHDEAHVQDAGLSPDDAAAGNQQSVVALIEHAAQNPAALRDAAVQFVRQDPQLLAQLPGLVQGVLGRL